MDQRNQIEECNSHVLSEEMMAALVRRHTHDLRNFLNGMEMELALLAETADETARGASIDRIRREMKHAEAMVRGFGAKFIPEVRSSVCVSDVAEQWMSDARRLLPEGSITWNLKADNALLQVNAGLLRSVLCDLVVLTAGKYPRLPLEAGCACEDGGVIFSVSCRDARAGDTCRDPSDQVLWSSLSHLVSRNNGRLECILPPAQNAFSCRLAFQLSS